MPFFRLRTRSGLKPSIGITANVDLLAKSLNLSLRAYFENTWKSFPSTKTTRRVFANCVSVGFRLDPRLEKTSVSLDRP